MQEIVYLNGSLVPRERAHVSVDDQGFLYGYALFETMRAYRGKIFLLERHLKRLADAARIIGLGSALAGVDLGKACYQTLKANQLDDARLRLTVSRGEADGFPGTGKTPAVVVTARQYTPLPPEKYEQGYRAGVASFRRYPSLISRLKSANYLVNVLARLEAVSAGLDEALLLDDKGFIAEGSTSNVFFVKDSGLVTPSLENGILPGITREVVMELAGELDINIAEGEISLSELGQFTEAFLTSSTMELMPLVSVRDEAGQMITIGSGRPGPVTKRLMAGYKERVEKETRA